MKDAFEISFDREGIRVKENLYPIFKLWSLIRGKGGFNLREISWRQIERIYAYKRDVFTTDLICLLLKGSDENIELNEQMEGWQNLLENLPGHLPGCKGFDEWFMEVAFPAFEIKLIEIYRKEI